MFDTTKHFSEKAIRKRNQERLKLQELEEERKKEKKREEEETERKRKEEERKIQEKRKKARVRRRALKERERHRQRRQKDRAKPETPQEPDSSEEWEERKYLLAQRRVEALRLLRVLLRKIAARLFASRFSVLGSSQFSPRDIDTAAKSVLGNMLQRQRKDLHIMYLQNCEEMSEYLVAKPDNKQEQSLKKRSGAYLHKSPEHLEEKRIKSSARSENIGKLLSDDCNDNLPSDQTSLEITLIPGRPLEKEDYCGSGQLYSCRLSERDHGRKEKIYETEEFTDYLLNYYQSPTYSRICLEPSHVTGPYQWQRAVFDKGNGLQINLQKPRFLSSNLSQMQNMKGRKQVQEEDYWTKTCREAFEYKPQKRGNVGYVKECTKEFQNHCKDTVCETSDQLSPTVGQNHLLEKTNASEVGDSKSTMKSQGSSPSKSADLDLELTDFFEEISSDSECFSEILSINGEKEKPVTTHTSSERGSPDTNKIIICNQENRPSHRTFYSKWKQNGDKEYSKYKLRQQRRRSRYKMRYSRLEGEKKSVRCENNGRKRAVLAPRYLSDRGYYYESSSSDLLNDVTRKRRRFSDNTFDQSVNYRQSCVSVSLTESANDFHGRNSPTRRESPCQSEHNKDTRRCRQHESSEDSMLKSDNHIRHNHQELLDHGNNLRNDPTSSLYLQMF